jgi:hypothetical protein
MTEYREKMLDAIIDICECGISREEKRERAWEYVWQMILQSTSFLRG